MKTAFMKRLAHSTKGATVVEYGLICALIVLGALGAITGLGLKTSAMWNNVATEVSNH